MTSGKTPLPDPSPHSAQPAPPVRKKGRAWRASLVTAASLALAGTCGLAVAAAPASATAAVPRTAAGSRVTYIGAFVGTPGQQSGRAAQWNTAYSQIGPLQSDKIFYGTGADGVKPLPPSFNGSVCDELEHQPVCVIAYKTASKQTLQSFVESMPAQRSSPVIMVYWDEPELGQSGMSPQTYKNNFDLRSQWVTQAAAAKHLSYVKVAMDSATYGYAPGGPGYDCSYLPAASYVDYYLTDVYQHQLTTLQGDADFQRWNECTAGLGKPQGLAEYGLGVCTKTGAPASAAEREQTLSTDAAYLEKNFPHLVLWEYWWSKISGSGGKCAHSWFSPSSVIATEWKKIEAGTVGS
jgi:hypothetical protein